MLSPQHHWNVLNQVKNTQFQFTVIGMSLARESITLPISRILSPGRFHLQPSSCWCSVYCSRLSWNTTRNILYKKVTKWNSTRISYKSGWQIKTIRIHPQLVSRNNLRLFALKFSSEFSPILSSSPHTEFLFFYFAINFSTSKKINSIKHNTIYSKTPIISSITSGWTLSLLSYT